MRTIKRFSLVMLLVLPSLGYGQIRFDPPVDNGINFGEVQVGQQAMFLQFIIATPINDVQQQVEIQHGGRGFTAEPARFVIGAGEIAAVMITFEPEEVRNYRDVLTVIAMNPNGMGAIYQINVSGVGIGGGDPEMVVEPDEIELLVDERGGGDEAQFIISNLGEAPLLFEVIDPDVDWLEVPELEGEIEPDQRQVVGISTTEDLPDNGDYQADITIESNDPNNREVIVEVTLTVDMIEPVERTISLDDGWSMISLNIDPAEEYLGDEGPDLRLVLEDIVDVVLLFKDGNGQFSVPGMDFWGIQVWDCSEGYLIKTQEEIDLVVSGYPIPLERELELEAGWNMIPYFPEYEDRFDYILSDLVERDLLVLAKNGYGVFYAPEWGVGGDTIAHPGEGFLVKVSRNCSFRYPRER